MSCQIRSFSPDLYEYTSHLQVAVSGFIIALGVAVLALAYVGLPERVRRAFHVSLEGPPMKGGDHLSRSDR